MKLWSEFYDIVMPELPGCSTDLADIALRETSIDFCEQTWALEAEHDPENTIAGIYEYELDSPESQTEIIAIKQAWIDDGKIDPISMDDLRAANTDWRVSSGQPTYYAQRDALNVLLYRVPDAVYELKMDVALRPTSDSTGIPDRLFVDYRKIIAAGAKAMLMGQPAKPWTNPTYEAKYRAEYEAAITKATVLVNRARARAQLQVRFRTV